jgi:hypothetical protein
MLMCKKIKIIVHIKMIYIMHLIHSLQLSSCQLDKFSFSTRKSIAKVKEIMILTI